MKPKYMFYLFMMILIHYEVGRIVSNSTPPNPDDQPSSQKGVKFDGNNTFYKPIGYEHKVRLISVSNKHKKHPKLLTAIYRSN